MGSSRYGELKRWGVHEMESSVDGKFTKIGVKLLGSNPGSFLRSKSTRHETRCEAACE